MKRSVGAAAGAGPVVRNASFGKRVAGSKTSGPNRLQAPPKSVNARGGRPISQPGLGSDSKEPSVSDETVANPIAGSLFLDPEREGPVRPASILDLEGTGASNVPIVPFGLLASVPEADSRAASSRNLASGDLDRAVAIAPESVLGTGPPTSPRQPARIFNPNEPLVKDPNEPEETWEERESLVGTAPPWSKPASASVVDANAPKSSKAAEETPEHQETWQTGQDSDDEDPIKRRRRASGQLQALDPYHAARVAGDVDLADLLPPPPGVRPAVEPQTPSYVASAPPSPPHEPPPASAPPSAPGTAEYKTPNAEPSSADRHRREQQSREAPDRYVPLKSIDQSGIEQKKTRKLEEAAHRRIDEASEQASQAINQKLQLMQTALSEALRVGAEQAAAKDRERDLRLNEAMGRIAEEINRREELTESLQRQKAENDKLKKHSAETEESLRRQLEDIEKKMKETQQSTASLRKDYERKQEPASNRESDKQLKTQLAEVVKSTKQHQTAEEQLKKQQTALEQKMKTQAAESDKVRKQLQEAEQALKRQSALAEELQSQIDVIRAEASQQMSEHAVTTQKLVLEAEAQAKARSEEAAAILMDDLRESLRAEMLQVASSTDRGMMATSDGGGAEQMSKLSADVDGVRKIALQASADLAKRLADEEERSRLQLQAYVSKQQEETALLRDAARAAEQKVIEQAAELQKLKRSHEQSATRTREDLQAFELFMQKKEEALQAQQQASEKVQQKLLRHVEQRSVDNKDTVQLQQLEELKAQFVTFQNMLQDKEATVAQKQMEMEQLQKQLAEFAQRQAYFSMYLQQAQQAQSVQAAQLQAQLVRAQSISQPLANSLAPDNKVQPAAAEPEDTRSCRSCRQNCSVM